MNKIAIVLFLILTSCSLPDGSNPFDPNDGGNGQSNLKIGAFNVQIFGQAFMENPDRVFYLREIIKRYDIILIQEIRDASGEAILQLLAPLTDYSLNISERLGRTSSKEQYAFIYKKNKISISSCLQYNDPNDAFEREPYTCQFLDAKTQRRFNLMALHTKPDDAKNELIEAELVYNLMNQSLDHFTILMGDLNADCSYLSDSDFNDLIFSLYHWLIPKNADTTTSASDCAYDNFVLDSSLINSISNPSVFDFKSHFGISEDLTLDISDHYPIEFDIELN